MLLQKRASDDKICSDAYPNYIKSNVNSTLFSLRIIHVSENTNYVQWNLDLRKPDLRKNLDLRKIVGTTDFLVHKLFDLRKIF